MKGRLGYKIRTITCAGCGKIRTGHLPPRQHYCSIDCYRSSPRPNRIRRFETHCSWCGKTLSIHNNRAGQPHYFCNKICVDAWQSRHKTTHICIICGCEFHWSPSRSKKHNIKYCSLACRDADPMRRELLARMNQQQRHDKINKLERHGYELLDAVGVHYFRQHLIGGKFCVDAFLPEYGLVVQFDGDYWHGNPDKYPIPDERQQKRIRLDASQDAYMNACGFEVLRFWEHEIKQSTNAVMLQLHDAIIRRKGWQAPST